MEDIHQAVLRQMGVGRRQYQSRDMLREQVGYRLDRDVPDRELRKAIEWLRQNDAKGAWIVSDSGYEGYWFGESIEEVKEHCRVTRNTAYTLFKRARNQIKLAERALEEPEQLRLLA